MFDAFGALPQPSAVPLFQPQRKPFWRLAAFSLAVFLEFTNDAASAGRLARGPYLQFANTNSIYVVWRTEGPVVPVVRFGEKPGALLGEAKEIVARASLGAEGKEIPARWEGVRTPENLKLPKLHTAPVGTFQYEAKLAGLKPATRYYYSVLDGDRPLAGPDASYSFITPPPVGTVKRVRFWALGDSGTGRQEQLRVHEAMREAVQRDGQPLDFWLHLGDMAYSTGKDVQFQSRFFETYDLTLRGYVCWPTMGNHEGYTSKGTTGIGPYFDAYVVPTRGEVGGVPSGTEAYYSFDYCNIHFVCLDSHDLERKPSGAMAKWLKADLEKTTAQWIIGFWHHPPYTKGSHDSDKEKDLTEMREMIMPLIDSGGVDLVLAGHSHIYERSMLIDGAYATPTVAENVVLDDGDGDPQGDGAYRKSEGINPHQGTVQIVAGNGGASMGRKGTIPFMRRTLTEHGSVLIDISGDTLTAKMINLNGSTRDFFSMVKRGTVEPIRIALPWQPPEYKKPETALKGVSGPAVDNKVLIATNSQWRYLAGEHPPAREWTRSEFDDRQWKVSSAPFGFGDASFKTELAALRGKPASLYLRREFAIEQTDKVTELGLWVDYKDGFVAYVNGREVARVGIGRSSGRNAQKIKVREGRGYAYVSLNDLSSLHNGTNTLAIEAHTAPENTMDFHLDAALLLED